MAYQTTYPYTGEVLKTYKDTPDSVIDKTLATAHALYQEWRQQPVSCRKPQLMKVASLIRKYRQDLARCITYDMGKLFRESLGEVDLCADIIEYYAIYGEQMMQPVDLPLQPGQGTRALH